MTTKTVLPFAIFLMKITPQTKGIVNICFWNRILCFQVQDFYGNYYFFNLKFKNNRIQEQSICQQSQILISLSDSLRKRKWDKLLDSSQNTGSFKYRFNKEWLKTIERNNSNKYYLSFTKYNLQIHIPAENFPNSKLQILISDSIENVICITNCVLVNI